MTNEGALIPVDEQTVDFYGDEITTALVKLDEHVHIYVPLRPICRYLGLSWSGQFERVKRNIFLSGKVRFVRVSRPNQAGDQNVLCLPIELLNGWFFGIASGR